MEHKEYLEYLKKHDPIHYYELTSNPTGTNSDDFSFVGIMLIIIILMIIFIFSLYSF